MIDKLVIPDPDEEEFGRGQETESHIVHESADPEDDKIEKLIEKKKAED